MAGPARVGGPNLSFLKEAGLLFVDVLPEQSHVRVSPMQELLS